MPTTCKVEFEDSPRKIVYAGQLLKGTVEVSLFFLRKPILKNIFFLNYAKYFVVNFS